VNDTTVPAAAHVIGLDEHAARMTVETAGLVWHVITRDGIGIPSPIRIGCRTEFD
jgi:hypothetical protein